MYWSCHVASTISHICSRNNKFSTAAPIVCISACYMTGPVHSRDKIYEVMGHDETKGELMALIPVGVPEDSSAPQPPRLPLEDVVTFID